MSFASILVASHGTVGARAAEAVALSLLRPGGSLSHVYVVAEFWLGMRGDDWLNNVAARIRYERHLESELEADIAAEVDRLGPLAVGMGFSYASRVKVGRPEECLLAVANELRPELVVMGAPRPKGMPGYRSRMALEPLAKGLSRPLLVVPHPGP